MLSRECIRHSGCKASVFSFKNFAVSARLCLGMLNSLRTTTLCTQPGFEIATLLSNAEPAGVVNGSIIMALRHTDSKKVSAGDGQG